LTIAHDAATQSATWTTTPDPFTFNHTPVGTPKGVVVMITINAESGADGITGVTYGGVSMTRITNGFAQDTDTEPGSAYIYFLGASIPTGTQTVSIDHTAGAGVKIACCVTVTAAADTEVSTSGKIDGDATDPQIALDSGANSSLRYFVINSGLPAPSSLTLISGMSAVASTDHGARTTRFDRQTSPSSGSTTVGYTAAIDDVAMVAVAIKESAGGAPVKIHRLTLLGVG
jgi:hypothetical protein